MGLDAADFHYLTILRELEKEAALLEGRKATSERRQVNRANGAFRDLFDFCERVDKRMVNRRVVEALIRAGVKLGRDYPAPIVNHEAARARALQAWAAVKAG